MRAITCVALLSGGLAVLAAQNQQPIRVGTSFVRVDVYPTKDGKIVDGLKAEDFEVLEDGVAQKIESFEHIVPVLGPQTARTDPSSQREMVRAIGDPRTRLFLIFLDGAFVDDESARQINETLRKLPQRKHRRRRLRRGHDGSDECAAGRLRQENDVMSAGLPTAILSWGRQDQSSTRSSTSGRFSTRSAIPGP